MRRLKRKSQPRLTDERRVPSLSCLHPILRAMVEMDADSSVPRVSVGWIINDAVARYYDSPEYSSTVIATERLKRS